jgi:hypothetical protein
MAIGIRDYLKNKYGVSDEDITYNNGTVMLKNRPYIYATPEADSKTYADPNQLAMADNNYAMQEALQQYKQRISQPIQQFSYDPNSDPAYQSALQQARQNAQTAGNNAMVALGSRGIGNSSITSDRVAQIQQREYGNVVNNVLPQLIQQAYQRYLGQQQLQNQQNGQLLDLANTYNNQNQQLWNQNRTSQQDHINLANQLSQEYGVPVMPKNDAGLAYEQVAGLTPLNAQQLQSQLNLQKAQANYYNEHGNYYDARAYGGGVSAGGSLGRSGKSGSTPQPGATPKYTTEELTQLINELDSMQNNPYQLRAKILSLNLPDDQTLALLKRYGQGEKPPTSYTGGR